MMITAADLGIGTGHSAVGDQEAARKILGVPDDHDVAYLIGVGWPADRPLRPIPNLNRRPFEDVVRHGTW
jgi:nitroreductase